MAGAIAAAPAAALAAAKKKASQGNPCADSDQQPDFPWQQFKDHDTCFEFTNSLSFVYQKVMQTSGIPPLPTRRNVASINDPVVNSFTYKPSFDSTTPTSLGDLKTTFDLSLEWSSDDTAIQATLSDGTVSLAGLIVGYTDSVMNFWSENFQFSATVPSRTVGVVRYEHAVSDNSKLGISLETGVATSSTSSKLFAPIYPDDPVLAGRWLYETDPLTVQVSAMVHQLKFDHSGRVIPALANQSDSVTGWAATAGATVTVPLLSKDDYVSTQATYAVNASPYLGTNADLSTLASEIPVNVETRGWSAVASYHRAWSDQWASNVFVSELALDISAPGANPAIRTTRFAANVIYNPVDYFDVGAEIGYIDGRIDPNGTFGIVSSASGQQWTGYLFAELDF